jgi:hypothetical protein
MCLLYNINLSFFTLPVNIIFKYYKSNSMIYIFYILVTLSSFYAGRLEKLVSL